MGTGTNEKRTAAQKKRAADKTFDLEKAKSISIKPGSKKTYGVDVKTIWDKDRDRPLVSSEIKENGDQFIETSDTGLQEKLEKMGYKDKKMVKVMHDYTRNNPGIKSHQDVEETIAGKRD